MHVRDVFLVFESGNVFSEGIAETTKSPRSISHTCVETSLGHVIEADFFNGVTRSDLSVWSKKNKNRVIYYSNWYTPKINPYMFVGSKYFRGFFVNFLLYRFFSWIKAYKIAANVINRNVDNKMICSTINARCRGISTYWKVLPKDLEIYIN